MNQIEQRDLYFAIDGDPSIAYYLNNQYHILVCTEDPLVEGLNNYPGYPNLSKVSLLLPPYEAVKCELDGDITTAIAIYNQYLINSSAINLIRVLAISALNKDRKLLLCFGSEFIGLNLIKYLLTFLYENIGLYFSNGNGPGSIDCFKVINELNNSFSTGLIGLMDFLTLYPEDMSLSNEALERMSQLSNRLISNEEGMKMVLEYKGLLNKNGVRLYCPFGGDVHDII